MDRSSLMRLLKEVTSRFTLREVSVYAIGGTALTLLGLKPSTVDVDFIMETLSDLRTFRSALKYSLGAKELSSEDPKRGDQHTVFIDGLRLDLYWGGVDAIVLTDSMKSRASEVDSVDWIRLMIPSHGDLLLTKLLAGRDKDLSDAITIVRAGGYRAWEVAASELIKQVGLTDKPHRLLSRIERSLSEWSDLRPPDRIHYLMEELHRILTEPPMKLVLFYTCTPMKGWEEELKDIKALLREIERLNIVVEERDLTDHNQEERKDLYFKFAVPPSVFRRYAIRRIFGSRRDPGFLFGDIPALIVYYAASRFPVEVYPHEIGIGSVVFLPSDFLRIALRAVTERFSEAN